MDLNFLLQQVISPAFRIGFYNYRYRFILPNLALRVHPIPVPNERVTSDWKLLINNLRHSAQRAEPIRQYYMSTLQISTQTLNSYLHSYINISYTRNTDLYRTSGDKQRISIRKPTNNIDTLYSERKATRKPPFSDKNRRIK